MIEFVCYIKKGGKFQQSGFKMDKFDLGAFTLTPFAQRTLASTSILIFIAAIYHNYATGFGLVYTEANNTTIALTRLFLPINPGGDDGFVIHSAPYSSHSVLIWAPHINQIPNIYQCIGSAKIAKHKLIGSWWIDWEKNANGLIGWNESIDDYLLTKCLVDL